jgi:hypothetical protein
MTKKIIAGCVIVILLAVAYWVGRSVGWSAGTESAVRSRMEHDVMVHTELVQLEKSLLTNVLTRPITMPSGRYTLETKIAGKPATASALEFQFSNGRLTRISGNVQQIVQTGNIVSWEQYDTGEDPSAIFVGVIDGDMMCGRVYVEPGQGWRQGKPLEYGVWTVRRAPAGAK